MIPKIRRANRWMGSTSGSLLGWARSAPPPTVPPVEQRGETPDQQRERVRRLYRAHGMIASSERVWRGGVDVTHEDPATWPWPYRMYAEGGRGPVVQADVLRMHAEAVEGSRGET